MGARCRCGIRTCCSTEFVDIFIVQLSDYHDVHHTHIIGGYYFVSASPIAQPAQVPREHPPRVIRHSHQPEREVPDSHPVDRYAPAVPRNLVFPTCHPQDTLCQRDHLQGSSVPSFGPLLEQPVNVGALHRCSCPCTAPEVFGEDGSEEYGVSQAEIHALPSSGRMKVRLCVRILDKRTPSADILNLRHPRSRR